MASEKEQVLVNVFWAVAGEGWRGVLANLLGLPIGEDAEAGAATVGSGSSRSGSSSSGSERSTASKVVDYASFGVAPLARAIFGLFSGGEEEPAPLTEFALPAAVRFETAVSGTGGGLSGVEYDQFGMPRVSEGASLGRGEAETGRRGDWVSEGAKVSAGVSAAPQVLIQVQAMDSRSFLDHSAEIAQAVREAMLNMHSVNDVVSEL